MKVLLWQNIDNLGKRGDVINVAPGYARNFLFPTKAATLTDPSFVRELEHEKKRLSKLEGRMKEDAAVLAKVIEKVSCTIEASATKEGILYGSITPQLISDALKSEKIELDPKKIEIKEHIKELGVYTVTAKLHPEVAVDFRIWVVEGKETVEKAAE